MAIRCSVSVAELLRLVAEELQAEEKGRRHETRHNGAPQIHGSLRSTRDYTLRRTLARKGLDFIQPATSNGAPKSGNGAPESE